MPSEAGVPVFTACQHGIALEFECRYCEQETDGVRVPLGWTYQRNMPMPHDFLHNAFESLILWAERGRETEKLREGVRDTPRRAARAWEELMRGYDAKLDLTCFDADGYDQMIVCRDLPFDSTCEHHLMRFSGTADFCYLPNKRILGLSKFARILDAFSRRLQVQERLTAEMATCVEQAVEPQGVMVVTRAEHSCMACRGVASRGHTTIMSVARGVLRESPTSKAEAMELLR